MAFEATRAEVVGAAREMLGARFLHQGRDPQTGIDCVGFLVVLANRLGYPDVNDVEGYRRTPSAEVIRQTLRQSCDEIPVSEVRDGDIFLMRMGGIKPRHVALALTDRGGEPCIIHASASGVKVQPLTDYPASWFVAGFRLRGLKD